MKKLFKWSAIIVVLVLDIFSTALICRAIYIGQSLNQNANSIVEVNEATLSLQTTNNLAGAIGAIQATNNSAGAISAIQEANNFDESIIPTQFVEGMVHVAKPVRLLIPKLKIDARIEQVGLKSDGSVATPSNPANSAWFNVGPLPGEKGDAVIVGHSGWIGNTPAVFDDLNKLRKGDRIYVLDEKGKTIVFAVRELRSYAEKDKAVNVFASDNNESGDNKARLNLITCSGDWNKNLQSYSTRLVVFTDEVI